MEPHTMVKPFSRIIGQDRAIRSLKEMMIRDKMPHAFLFCGLRGVGKTTTALALTQTINCNHSEKGDACGQCRSCRQIMSGNFPDISIVEPESQVIKIEQIRGVNRNLSFRPVVGRYRVSIIEQAESMTEEAANAFLKTLEEPPFGNIIILNVTDQSDLLSTIVSRCRKVSFRPLSVSAIAGYLQEQMGMDEENSLVLARISEGSLGRAVHLYDNNLLDERQHYFQNIMKIRDCLPHETLEIALELTEKAKKGDKEKEEGRDLTLRELLELWKSWYRDLLVLKVDGSTDLLINIDFSRTLQKSVKHFKLEHLIESFLVLNRAQKELKRNPNMILLMENTLLSLQKFARPAV